MREADVLGDTDDQGVRGEGEREHLRQEADVGLHRVIVTTFIDVVPR